MAEEDDETFPPEVQKLPTEFAFREFGRLSLVSEENDSILHIRSSLLAVANAYGLVFVGHSDGFKVFTDSSLFDAAKMAEECRPEPLIEVQLRSPPHWLAVSSDNLTLIVCSSSEKGLQALFFDTRNLINKAKPTKTPFCIYPLSKAASDTVSSLHWNPSVENAQYLAICISSGAFYMLSLTDDVTEVGRRPSEFGACSACWSPRGKQVMIGKRDGSMQQYTPALEIRRAIPVYDAIERNVKVDDILWLSTFQVAFSYTPVSDGDWQPSLFVVNLPSAKEQNKRPSWRNYEDPCYGMAQQRPSHFMMSFVDKWNLFVISSADASETAIIAKDKKSDVWEIWNLDDSCRAQLPMEENNDEPSPLGVALLYTASDRIIVDDTRECGAMPVFVMLSCDGHLSMFHMINLQSKDEYPSITMKPTQLSPEGERAAVVSKLGSFDPNKAAIDSGKFKIAGKASVMASSTPLQPLAKPRLQESSQLSTTPLHSGGLYDPDKSVAAAKFGPRSLAFPNQSTPAASGSTRENIENQPTVLGKPAVAPLDWKSMTKAPLSKTQNPYVNSMVAPAPVSSVPFLTAQSKLESKPSFNRDSSIGRPSAASTQPNFAGRSSDIAKSDVHRKSTATLPKEPPLERSLSTHSSSSVLDGLVSEVTDFEKELESFINESADLNGIVDELGGNEDKVGMRENVENLSDFSKGIAKTTQEQHDEIRTVRDLTLDNYAALQSVQTHRQRIGNPAYRSALYARPLDIADQRKMKGIRTLYHHIRETMKEVDMVLDDQWNKLMQKKSSALHKSKRRLKFEERETVRQALENQTKILHHQETNLLLLGQKLDNLRIFNTSWQFPYIDQPVHDRKDEIGDSTDLATLASSLIHRDKEDPVRQSDQTVTKSPGQAGHISPQKASQLSEFLTLRKSAAIRTSFAKKSKFIAPPVLKPRSKEDQQTSEQTSRSSRFSSGDYSEESEESVVSIESQRQAERAPNCAPGYYLPDANPGQAERISAQVETGLSMQDLHRSLAARYSVYQTQQQAMGAVFPTPAQSASIQGSSTFTYGGPELPMYNKPVKKFDASLPMAEAASNLNNPPTVVNIKELGDSQAINPLLAPKTFEAKPSVPLEVANEVQKVLDIVHAEQAQQDVPHGESPQPDLSQHVVIHSKQSSFPSTEIAKQPLHNIAHTKQASFPSANFPTASTSSSDITFPPSVSPFRSGIFTGSGSNLYNQPSVTSQPSTITQSSFSMNSPFSAQPTNALGENNSVRRGSGEQQPSPRGLAEKPQLSPVDTSASIATPLIQKVPTKEILESDAPPEGTSLVTSARGSLAELHLAAKQSQESKQLDAEAPHEMKLAFGNLKQGNGESSRNPTPTAAPSGGESTATSSVSHSKEPSSEAEPGGSAAETENAEPHLPTSTPPFKPDLEAQKTEDSTLGAASDALSGSSSNISNVIASTTPVIPQSSDTKLSTGEDVPSSSSAETPTATATSDPSVVTNSSSAFTSTGFSFTPATSPGGLTFGTASNFGTVTATSGSTFGTMTSTFGSALGSVNAPESSFGALASTSSAFGATTSTPFEFQSNITTSSSLFAETTSSSVIGAPTPATSSAFGVPATTTSSVFGAPATSSAFGAPATSTSSAFGVPAASTSSVFGAPAASSVFGVPAASTSSVFGAPAASSVFGVPDNNNSGVFGSGAEANAQSFGTTAGFGSKTAFSVSSTVTSFGNVSAAGGFDGASGGGFLSGLGSAPKQSSGNSNPFESVASVQASDNKSLFGNTSASPFSSTFGQSPASGAFGANQSEGSKGFGSFIKPATGGFGGAPVFGSPPAFGAKSGFGAAPPFGSPSSGFGSPATFGSQQGNTASTASGFASAPGFGAFASSNATGFGTLAQQGGSAPGGFGNMAQQNTGASGGFGGLVQQTGGASGGFGTMAQQTGGAFGGFGQQSSGAPGGFGAMAQQGDGTTSGFGAMANQPTTGFGNGGFGSAPSGKPSFSEWR